ncbi:MAG TPA: GntR family transcriptional regulator [Caldilineaceae bacterium]|nr:GntR family transcriptional regulator [Caldilineaceae bacterium]
MLASPKFRSKSELAYLWLRDAIIEGRLAPGSRLVIDELAPTLGVSQIPIREALSQLQAEGFVTYRPHAGATVSELHPSLAYEIFGLLEATEVICGRTACTLVSDAFLDELEARLRQIDGLVDDPERFSQENARFHQLICHQAGTILVETIVANVWLHWDRLRRHYLVPVFARQTRIAQQEHWLLLAALRARDPDQVEEISRRHNRRAKEAYHRYMESQHAADRPAPQQDGDTPGQP